MAATPSGNPPAGWYADPQNPSQQRYWNGASWGNETRPAPGAGAPPPPPGYGAPGGAQPGAPAAAPGYAQPGAGYAGGYQAGGYPAAGYQPVPYGVQDPYDENVDLSQVLTPEQREAYKQHGLTSFSVPLAIVLHFLTLGIFTTIYQGLKFSKLPLVKHDDFTAGKGIGFLLIPYFNLYWLFRFWPALADRINFQFRLRGLPSEVSRSFVMTTCILTVIPFINFIAFLFVYPFMIAQLQGATNRLAPGS